jgi:hypothetical protein
MGEGPQQVPQPDRQDVNTSADRASAYPGRVTYARRSPRLLPMRWRAGSTPGSSGRASRCPCSRPGLRRCGWGAGVSDGRSRPSSARPPGGAEAERLFEDALERHAQATPPFERARTQLAFRELLRRERRRREARTHLRRALDAFDGLGAVLWADRARGELRATGERRGGGTSRCGRAHAAAAAHRPARVAVRPPRSCS